MRKVTTPKTTPKMGTGQRSKQENRDIRLPETLVEMVLLNAEVVKDIAAYLQDEERVALVDYALDCGERSKALEAREKAAKQLLMVYAENESKKDLSTSSNSCKVGASSSTETGTPTQLIRILKDERKLNLVDDILSVKVGEAKKYLGEKFLEAKGFIKKVSEPYGRLTIKRR